MLLRIRLIHLRLFSTVNKLNNDYFEVQRSLDGTDFNTLATIAGSGTSTSINSYSYLDVNAILQMADVLYYRIKQVDYNNSVQYSDVISLAMENTAGIELFPIPAKNYVNLRFQPHLLTSERMEILIYDQRGNLAQLTEHNSASFMSVSTEELTTGLYVMAIRSGSQIYLKRLLIE